MPKDIHPEAVKLLEDYGYLWDPGRYAFRRQRRLGKESTEKYLAQAPVVISHEELSDHSLVQPDNLRLSADQREQALTWLRARIKELEQ